MKLNVTRLENERVSLVVRVQEYESKVKEFEAKIHLVPEIESQLIALNRGYEITRGKYNELLSRREQARLSQNADLTADDIQFKVVDPPRVPLKPTGPNHVLFTTMVTFAGIIAGIGIAFLLSQINPVALTANQLKMISGYPVFGVVSFGVGTKVTLREQLRFYCFWSGLILILAAYAVLVLWHMEIIF
jgi:capsular polysaccharide biosynthesis protein